MVEFGPCRGVASTPVDAEPPYSSGDAKNPLEFLEIYSQESPKT